MIDLPERIKATFLRIKKERSNYVEIKHIKNYFFVYQSTSRWDKERRKPIKVPLYIGRIKENGEFIKAGKKKPRAVKAIAAESTIKAPQQLPQPSVEENKVAIEPDAKSYKHEAGILRALSMNGRISIPTLSKIIGTSEARCISQLKKLEGKYSIKYIAEIDITKLGYIQFLITIKFLDEIPKIDDLRNAIADDNRIEMVFLTKGDFHLAIYALAKDSIEINSIIIKIRKRLHYKSISITAPLEEDYGFIRLRPEFIESLKNSLLVREYAVLKELTINGKIDFSEIDRKYGFDKGRSQYSYYKLKQQGIIKRITISIENLPIKYIGIITAITTDIDKFIPNREKLLQNIVYESKYNINKYVFIADTASPSGIILYVPVFIYGDLESAVEEIANLDLGIKLDTLIITDILIGNFCFRNFDNAYSIQKEILIKEYNQKSLPRIDYEETGRIKKEKTYTKDIRGIKIE